MNSCKSKKEVTETSDSKKIELVDDSDKSLIGNGFQKAIVTFDSNKKEPCSYLYRLENGTVLEPHYAPKTMLKNKSTVYIKYMMQRRMSRCGSAQPVEITDLRVITNK
jgi:hypothetical protein